MSPRLLLLLAIGAAGLGGCRTAIPFRTPDPVVTPAARDAEAPALPQDICCASWCCGPERGRLWRRVQIELEAGPVWQSRNDVAIPGDTGTRFALDDLTGAGPFPYGRVIVDVDLAPRHGLRALIAPLELSGTSTLAGPVTFRGAAYAAGVPTRATYRFNSYRLTYRYLLACCRDSALHVGATVKIRDAKIALRQGALSRTKYDLGVVPLLHVAFEQRLSTRLRFAADADFAAAPQGRAIDFAAKLYYDLDDRRSLAIGYRMVEGGADNDTVYTFAWFHQAVLSASFRF